MKSLLVGLGNPGSLYKNTRHNVGFKVVEAFAEEKKVSWKEEKKFFGWTAYSEELIFLLPSTYMNLSGHSVKVVCQYYGLASSDILIVYDDADLDFKKLKIRLKGGSGGHKGIESVKNSFQTEEFPRLRVGIGRPKNKVPLQDYVLSPFSEEEEKSLSWIFQGTNQILTYWSQKNLDKACKEASHFGEERNVKN